MRKHLESKGAWVFKVHGGDNPYQEVGIPDLLCCYLGCFLALEVKLPGEKPSPVQQRTLRLIQMAGGEAHAVSSVDEVDKILRRISRKGSV